MTELLVVPSELERAAGRLQASADQVRSVVGTLLATADGKDVRELTQASVADAIAKIAAATRRRSGPASAPPGI